MAEAISPTAGRRYGVERVCRVWGVARSTFYSVKAVATEERPRREGRSPRSATPIC